MWTEDSKGNMFIHLVTFPKWKEAKNSLLQWNKIEILVALQVILVPQVALSSQQKETTALQDTRQMVQEPTHPPATAIGSSRLQLARYGSCNERYEKLGARVKVQ